MTADILQAFAEQLRTAGLMVGYVKADGALHRCPVEGKSNGKDGVYKAFTGNPATIWWKNWRTGEEGSWTARSEQDMAPEQRKALRERITAAQAESKAEQERQWAEVAKYAANIWKQASPADPAHLYLQKKAVPAFGLRQTEDGRLIVPVLDAHGKEQSLQFIDCEGNKRFLKGGKTAGGLFPIPAKDDRQAGPLLICEGYATGASLHLATGHTVLVAFNAGNLENVALAARARHADREIILCADNDCQTTKADGTLYNPGKTSALKAAKAIDGKMALCPTHEGKPTDFNDLHLSCSLEAVQAVVEKARAAKTVASDVLPPGFTLRKGGALPGLWHTEPKEDGTPVETWLGGPLKVLGATRDENGNAWGLLLEWTDEDNNIHTWAMPKAMLVGRDNSAVLSRLADEGWRFASSPKAKNLLCRFLSEYQSKKRILCVPCTGWHHGTFVFPDTTYQKIVGQAEIVGKSNNTNELSKADSQVGLSVQSDEEQIVLQVRTAHNPFRTGGTLEGWQNSIGIWSRGNSRIMLTLCASLAATLLEATGMESGGINWIGPSSSGKTTMLAVGASVWGKGTPSGGYVLNWRATSNGLEGLAALHSDAALCLDELGQAPGRTIMEASYMLANGMGKSRASQDGSARAIKSWRCMILSTGEKGLAEKIADEGGRIQAGQTVRLIDIPADAGAGMGIFEHLHGHESPRAFADAIRQAASADYGHAARTFIRRMQGDYSEALSSLHTFISNGQFLMCSTDVSGQVQRVARRFLLCAAAGEMAAGWQIVPWEKGEALQAAKSCFVAWLGLRGSMGDAEDIAIIEQVSLFIEQHGTSRFQDLDTGAATCINRVGFRRKVDGGIEYLILPESFRAEVCRGVNARKATAVLLEKGLLLPGDGRNLMRKPPVNLPDYGRKRCYTILIKEASHDLAE